MMNIHLANSTGNAPVDEILRWIVNAVESTCPQRVRAYYARGSYTDGTDMPSSDIDLTIVFKDHFLNEEERRRAIQVFTRAPSHIELDIDFVDEAELAGGVEPSLKLTGILVYGEDIREDFQLLSVRDWGRLCMHKAYYRTIRVFKRSTPVTYPLTYPDPLGDFYGYDQCEEAARVFDRNKVRLADGSNQRTTRSLVAVTLWTATAMLAHRADRYAISKRECPQLYSQFVGDEWVSLVNDLYTTAKITWRCAIPRRSAERKMLRAMCERTLSFENHFLDMYRDFVLAELQESNERSILFTLWMLQQIPYNDAAITCALRGLATGLDTRIRQAARETVDQLPQA